MHVEFQANNKPIGSLLDMKTIGVLQNLLSKRMDMPLDDKRIVLNFDFDPENFGSRFVLDGESLVSVSVSDERKILFKDRLKARDLIDFGDSNKPVEIRIISGGRKNVTDRPSGRELSRHRSKET